MASTPLTGTDGQPFSLTKDTDKPLTLVFFGYTHCPDICQTVMANLASAMTRLDEADRDRVDVVLVTTDPARDTESVLETYLTHLTRASSGSPVTSDTIVDVAKPLGVGITRARSCRRAGTRSPTDPRSPASTRRQGSVYWDERRRRPTSPPTSTPARRVRTTEVPVLTALSIPSPSSGVWYLGPLPLRGYALAIILGIVAAIWIGEAVGGAAAPPGHQDLAIWAVPFGLVGGRLYHVATDHDLYFGAGTR